MATSFWGQSRPGWGWGLGGILMIFGSNLVNYYNHATFLTCNHAHGAMICVKGNFALGSILFSVLHLALVQGVVFQTLAKVRYEGTTLKSICQVTCGCYYQFPPYTWRKIGGYDTSMHLTAQPTWYGGALERPPNLNKLCDPGKNYNTRTGLCEDCPSGKYTFHKGRSQCELCQAGTHSSNSRSSNCQARGCAFR